MRNVEIRRQIERAGARYWQVAEAIGISNSTLTIWLRSELVGERLARVQDAIGRLSGGEQHEHAEAD